MIIIEQHFSKVKTKWVLTAHTLHLLKTFILNFKIVSFK